MALGIFLAASAALVISLAFIAVGSRFTEVEE